MGGLVMLLWTERASAALGAGARPAGWVGGRVTGVCLCVRVVGPLVLVLVGAGCGAGARLAGWLTRGVEGGRKPKQAIALS